MWVFVTLRARAPGSGQGRGTKRTVSHAERWAAALLVTGIMGSAGCEANSYDATADGAWSEKRKERAAEIESEMTSGQRLALQAAREYFDLAGLSRTSVIGLLASTGALWDPGHGGFSKAEARFAVDSAGADWEQEAVEAARAHLESFPWSSRDELIHDLSAQGVSSAFFTPAEADYAADVVLPWGQPHLDPVLIQNQPAADPKGAASSAAVAASGSEVPW